MDATNAVQCANLGVELATLLLQLLGISFLIYTFVIMFYHQVLQRERRISTFQDWMRDWVLVWICITIPVMFVTSMYSIAHLWGFGGGLVAGVLKSLGLDNSARAEACANLTNATFKEFYQQSLPYVGCVYVVTIALLVAEIIIIWKQYNQSRQKLLTVLLLLPFFIGVILALLVLTVLSPGYLPYFPYLLLLVYFIWILSWFLIQKDKKFNLD